MFDVLTNSAKARETGYFRQFPSPERAKEHLLENFSAQAIPDSRLIAVEMTYRDPRDARTVVEEVVEQYIRLQQTRASEQWAGKAAGLKEQLRNDTREYKKVTQQLTNTSTTIGSESLFQLYSQREGKKYEVQRLEDARLAAERE